MAYSHRFARFLCGSNVNSDHPPFAVLPSRAPIADQLNAAFFTHGSFRLHPLETSDRSTIAASDPRMLASQAHSSNPPKPVTRIEARTGWQAVNLAQLWAYRELLYFLIWRDIKVRYKQTVLGAAWAVIQPVMTMVVFSLFFGRLGGMSKLVADVPYPVFIFAGLLAWTLFAAIVSQASVSLINSGNMISKIYFPRLLVPVATAGTALVDFVLSLLVMAFLMAGYGVSPSANVALLPLFVAGIVVAGVGVGALLAALVVAYRDFRYVIGFLIQLWMFASPVAYPLEVVPAEWRLAYSLNPVVGMIAGFRACLLGSEFPWECIAVSFFAAAVMLMSGLIYFRQVERRFADVI
jgi:lipopolysaccharide transport system permease protein